MKRYSRTSAADNPAASAKLARQAWFGYAFLSLFMLAGVAAFYFISVAPALRWYQTQNWVAVPAELVSLRLETLRGDSVTYRLDGQYRYVWQGQARHNSQISIYQGSDSGDYWRQLESQLNYLAKKGALYAYVNPAQPEQAVLARQYRGDQFWFGFLFMSLFCGVSGLFMYLLRRGQQQKTAQQRLLQGDMPTEGISSDNKTAHQAGLLIGGIFLAFGLPMSVMILLQALPKAQYAALLVLLFPAVGSVVVYQAYKAKRLWQQIGKTPFIPDPFPGNAGGQIGGYFQLAQGKFVNPPQCVLRCLHKYDSGSGKNRSTKTDTLWQQQQPASADLSAKYRVLFDVPANLPGSGEHAGYEGSIVWQLSCEAELRQQNQHMEFSRDWTLPVIAGSAKAQWQRSEAETQVIQQQLKQQAAHSAASQIMTHQSGGKLQLISAAGRHLSSALTLTLFGAVFASAGGFMFYLAMHDGGVPWIMAPVFSLVGVVILALGVFWLGRGLQANIGKREVQTIRSMFGMRLYQRNAAIADNAELALVKTLTSTKPNGHSTEYYRLQLQLEHTTLVLAEGIIGRDAAEVLKQQVEQQLFA